MIDPLFIAVLLISLQTFKCQEFDYFTCTECPPLGTNTASNPMTTITFRPTNTTIRWPDLSRFIYKRKNEIIFIYNPSLDNVVMANQRFTLNRVSLSLDFVIAAKFVPYEDGGVDFQFGYLPNKLVQFVPLCSIVINEDLTPEAKLSRRPPYESGIYFKKDFMEGEKVIIICRVLKMTSNDSFQIIFPPKSYPKVELIAQNFQQYSVILTKDIKGGNISCIIQNGYSTWSADLLKFFDKPIIHKDPDRTVLAIAISVFFGILLSVMIIVGGYMLIIKQRSDVTQQIVEHHTEVAKEQRATQLTYMSRLSVMPPKESVMKVV